MSQTNGQKPLSREDLRINFFRPRPGFMRREVIIIWITLAAWAIMIFGMPVYLAITYSYSASTLAEVSYTFGVPSYFWFSSQFLILWFVFLCFSFNVLIDWLSSSYRKRR